MASTAHGGMGAAINSTLSQGGQTKITSLIEQFH
jgi:hypothetical protein